MEYRTQNQGSRVIEGAELGRKLDRRRQSSILAAEISIFCGEFWLVSWTLGSRHKVRDGKAWGSAARLASTVNCYPHQAGKYPTVPHISSHRPYIRPCLHSTQSSVRVRIYKSQMPSTFQAVVRSGCPSRSAKGGSRWRGSRRRGGFPERWLPLISNDDPKCEAIDSPAFEALFPLILVNLVSCKEGESKMCGGTPIFHKLTPLLASHRLAVVGHKPDGVHKLQQGSASVKELSAITVSATWPSPLALP